MITNDPTPHLSPSYADLLMNLIIALLAPMFLGVAAGDVTLARMAARETVNAYRAESQADLIAVAQIIAFGLAALGSLSLSMADDISLSMTLRLRGNAIALNRSAEQNRKSLGKIQRNVAEAWQDAAPTAPDHAPFLSPEAEQTLAAEARARLATPEPIAEAATESEETAPRRDQEMWAIALASEASEISVSVPNLPPGQQPAAIAKAAQLSSAAHNLLYGPPISPLELIAVLAAAQQDPEQPLPLPQASHRRPEPSASLLP